MSKIEVRKSQINKKGVFATKNIAKGEVAIAWKPLLLNEKAIDKLKPSEKHYINEFADKKYLMQSPEKYINHSCEPNTFVKDWTDVAARDIKKGEEITSDYEKMDGQIEVSFKCNCGSPNCRKFIK